MNRLGDKKAEWFDTDPPARSFSDLDIERQNAALDAMPYGAHYDPWYCDHPGIDVGDCPYCACTIADEAAEAEERAHDERTR